MSIENIQNASERDDTRPAGQAGERSYDPYLTDNTGLLEAYFLIGVVINQ